MTPNLGNSFPPQAKDAWCREKLTRGAVVRTRHDFGSHQKDKRVVLWGFCPANDCVGYSIINTEGKRPTDLHLPADPSQRPYLDHDSFLATHRVYEIDFDTLLETCLKDTGIYLGSMALKDICTVATAIANSPTIPPKIKKCYGFI